MAMLQHVKALIFDWGDTVMRDFGLPGAMAEWEKVAWIPGAEEALKIFSANFICVIATSADHSGTEEMVSALKRVGADQYFHHFFSSKQIGFKKPDPQFFEAIARLLNLRPSNCAMIGNLYEKDIVGAKKAGMHTILFDENKQQKYFEDADAVVYKMQDLLQLFS